jgi:hypothetical protein
VVWIVFENKSYNQIIGSANAPYLNSLAQSCGLATNFTAEAHPSLPNYIAMTSGSTQGVTDNADPSSHPLSVASIFSQLGSGWRSLQESMPSNCYPSNSGDYLVRHNPAAYYTNVNCAAQDVPLGQLPDLSARFTFITPNRCNGMHDCTVSTGDSWLSGFMAKVLGSSEYAAGQTAVFITWDEDDSSSSQHIATLVVSPYTPTGVRSATPYNHYSLLRTTEELLGLGTLGNARTAPSMGTAFGLARYPIPVGASPLRVSVVPAFEPCETTNANSTHGRPLNFPACTGPSPASSTVRFGSNALGFARMVVCPAGTSSTFCASPGSPMPLPDLRFTGSIRDVKCAASLPVGQTACAAPGADYNPNTNVGPYTSAGTGSGGGADPPCFPSATSSTACLAGTDLTEVAELPGASIGGAGTPFRGRGVRITDRASGVSRTLQATVVDIGFPIPLDCISTPNSSSGSNCGVNTTANALVPGVVQSGNGAVWQLGEIELKDSGPDGLRGNSDDQPFAVQGIFAP